MNNDKVLYIFLSLIIRESTVYSSLNKFSLFLQCGERFNKEKGWPQFSLERQYHGNVSKINIKMILKKPTTHCIHHEYNRQHLVTSRVTRINKVLTTNRTTMKDSINIPVPAESPESTKFSQQTGPQ